MNRLYIVANDGRLFFSDSQSNSFEPIENLGSDELIAIKRLSTSPWCLWCVSAKFDLCLYTFLIDTPLEHQEVTYENQVLHSSQASIGFFMIQFKIP